MRVGVFDSGLGGLTVVKSIQNILKGAELFYIADTFYAPYGIKKYEQILQRCDEITKYFIKKYDIQALVVACNTATSVAIKHLRQTFPNLIIVGTEPGIKPAIANTTTGNIGVLATISTLKGNKYAQLVNELSNGKNITLHESPCVGLVEQIEKDKINSKKTFEMLQKWLEPMKQNNVDTIVLGCTHYPLVDELIKKIMGENICLIQTGDAIATHLLNLSKNIGHVNEGNLLLSILHTGNISKNMIQTILNNKNIEIKKCEI